MPRECTVCSHPDAVLINEALVVQKASNRVVARQYDLHHDAIRRHRMHIPEMLAKASRAEEVAQADTLLDRIEGLQRRTEAILSRVEGTDNYSAQLGAIREMRANLTIIGEITKELNRTPTLNLVLNPEYVAIRTAIVEAVEGYPDVREAITTKMLELENGNSPG
jgi:hypothetical protein